MSSRKPVDKIVEIIVKDNARKYTSIGIVIMAVHIMYAVLLGLVHVWPLFLYNSLAVIIYLIFSFVVAPRGQYIVIYATAVLEVLTCSVFATMVLGKEWGYMFYTVALVPVSFYLAYTLPGFDRGSLLPALTTIFVAVVYFIVDVVAEESVAEYDVIPRSFVNFFYYFDTAVAFGILLAFSWLFAVEVRYMQEQIEDENRRLQEMAMYDPLTGLYNRRTMVDKLNEQFEKSEDSSEEYYLVMADIDDFKMFNDTYGHDMGDRILKEIATAFRININGDNIVCRWGGEEFLALVHDSKEDLENMLDKVRDDISNIRLPGVPFDVVLTVTMGVSYSEPGKSMDRLISIADHKMYDGKRKGKNRIIW